VEIISRFKGLELVNQVPGELWTEVRNTVQKAMNKTTPNKSKNEKWLSGEAWHITNERRDSKSKGQRGRCIQLNTDFQRTAWREKKEFFNDHVAMFMCKVISCVIEKGYLPWPVRSLIRIQLVLPCFILFSKAKLACYSRYFLTFYFCIRIPNDE